MSDAPDDGIPVLTDIVETPVPVLPAARPTAAPRSAAPSSGPPSGLGPASIPGAVPLTRSGPPSLSEFGNSVPSGHFSVAPHPNSAEAFAERVQAAVLERLLARIEPAVEAHLRQQLPELLETVLAEMGTELKQSAAAIIRETVAQAVADEITAQRERDHPSQ